MYSNVWKIISLKSTFFILILKQIRFLETKKVILKKLILKQLAIQTSKNIVARLQRFEWRHKETKKGYFSIAKKEPQKVSLEALRRSISNSPFLFSLSLFLFTFHPNKLLKDWSSKCSKSFLFFFYFFSFSPFYFIFFSFCNTCLSAQRWSLWRPQRAEAVSSIPTEKKEASNRSQARARNTWGWKPGRKLPRKT